MHEVSIATAMLEVARPHVPAGCRLRRVRIIAGPLQSIDSLAMDFAWRAVTDSAGLSDVQLDLQLLRWKLQCPDCGRVWDKEIFSNVCVCGGRGAFLVGGSELQVASIEVDDVLKGEPSCKSQ
jgi:Zn finger protein HypA/HybF involved in hydrogenase expression